MAGQGGEEGEGRARTIRRGKLEGEMCSNREGGGRGVKCEARTMQGREGGKVAEEYPADARGTGSQCG